MSTVSAVSTHPGQPAMAQRRRSSLGQSPPLSHVGGDSGGRASPGGRDVTPTSPSGGSSIAVSLRGLPPPALYQPPQPPLERKSSTTRGSFSVSPGSPTSVAAEPSSGGSSATTSNSKSSSAGGKVKENTGRWQAEEHEVFLKGLNEHGKQWKKIAMMIKTRSVVQVRTHAQKYFQKLLKNEKKEEGRSGKERSSSILSTSTATSVAQTTPSGAVKRKSSSKGNKTTVAAAAAVKKRRVSLEPKPKKQQQPPLPHHQYQEAPAAPPAPVQHVHHHHHQAPPPPPPPPQALMATAPPMPVPPPSVSSGVDHNVIDPSFMNTLNMASGDLDDSLLDLLDDSSVEAVEQVIGSDDDMDLEPNKVEANPVSPSVSSMSLADTAAAASGAVVHPTPAAEVMANRHEIVSSPNPENFSVHNSGPPSNTISGRELSPTSVACMMDIKDFEQKTSSYVDALDWLMDVGVHQLPATANEQEEEWANGHPSGSGASGLAVPVVPKLSASKLAQVNSSALSVLDGDVF